MEITPLFSGMDVSATGLSAQRKRMNAIAENLANSETTRTKEGGPYRRQQTSLTQDVPFASELEAAGDYPFSGVKANVTRDPAPFREVYDPDHPDADENGMVKMPNVDIVQEMTELISASRAYEANATAFNASKGMMKKALEL
jgi:flagellar basal-body rod protein FlgC